MQVERWPWLMPGWHGAATEHLSISGTIPAGPKGWLSMRASGAWAQSLPQMGDRISKQLFSRARVDHAGPNEYD